MVVKQQKPKEDSNRMTLFLWKYEHQLVSVIRLFAPDFCEGVSSETLSWSLNC